MSKPEVVTILTAAEFEEQIANPALDLAQKLLVYDRQLLASYTPAQQAAAHIVAVAMLCPMFNANPAEYFASVYNFMKPAFEAGKKKL
jgi:hypothetical protein